MSEDCGRCGSDVDPDKQSVYVAAPMRGEGKRIISYGLQDLCLDCETELIQWYFGGTDE